MQTLKCYPQQSPVVWKVLTPHKQPAAQYNNFQASWRHGSTSPGVAHASTHPAVFSQLRSIPVKNAEDDELEEEADWIYRNAFATPTISLQVKDYVWDLSPKRTWRCCRFPAWRRCSRSLLRGMWCPIYLSFWFWASHLTCTCLCFRIHKTVQKGMQRSCKNNRQEWLKDFWATVHLGLN